MAKGSSAASATQLNASSPTRLPTLLSSSRFQCINTPKPTTMANGAISGMKTAMKYGGPTDNFPSPKASITSGYKVPNKILAAVTTSSTLLINNTDSRDTSSKLALLLTSGARMAYSSNDPPTTTAKNTKMNTPRAGSLAKACTEVNTPERTKNVPSKLKEKAKIANSTVQVLNTPRFSVAASE